MRSRRPPTIARWTAWVFALALLLKAAVPMLAGAAAEAQGRTLVEVCTVYGVEMVALDAGDSAPAEHATHGPEHCALGGLLLGGAPHAPPAGRLALESCTVLPTPAQPRPPAPDACAAWVAQLKHGPPHLA
ncbi:MAG TPA: DUF2946 family protein [Methylibium sp.]|uniref:DUF2946 family protein n=1 Tax=Methylibium sp. TaxID=2067992 RepID=UPI002DBBE920|nr:DUF2946 family protein [Methylibium sp.]HEU4458782.1 DUF2946 family protein [Methylibium sp.]